MSTHILINNMGQTENDYTTCGDDCTVLVLSWLGIPFDDCDPNESYDLGDDVTVECPPLGESSGDCYCAACGDFMCHGTDCDCSHIGGVKLDPEPLDGPHIDFRDRA